MHRSRRKGRRQRLLTSAGALRAIRVGVALSIVLTAISAVNVGWTDALLETLLPALAGVGLVATLVEYSLRLRHKSGTEH